MKIALSGQPLANTHKLESIIEIVRTFGIGAIELWPENIPGGETQEERGRYEGKDIHRICDILQASQMSVACVTMGSAIKHAAMRGLESGTEALIGTIDAASLLGSALVNCYLSNLSPEFFVEMVKPAVEYAARKNITLVLENEAHDDSGTAEGVKAIIEQIDSPYFGTVYDPCNYYQAHREPYPEAYEILKGDIRYVHLKGGCRYNQPARPQDHRGGTLRGHKDVYIGYTSIVEGVVNANGILCRLLQDDYTGFITLEPHVREQDALAYYRTDVLYVQACLQTLGIVEHVRDMADGFVSHTSM